MRCGILEHLPRLVALPPERERLGQPEAAGEEGSSPGGRPSSTLRVSYR